MQPFILQESMLPHSQVTEPVAGTLKMLYQSNAPLLGLMHLQGQ